MRRCLVRVYLRSSHAGQTLEVAARSRSPKRAPFRSLPLSISLSLFTAFVSRPDSVAVAVPPPAEPHRKSEQGLSPPSPIATSHGSSRCSHIAAHRPPPLSISFTPLTTPSPSE